MPQINVNEELGAVADLAVRNALQRIFGQLSADLDSLATKFNTHHHSGTTTADTPKISGVATSLTNNIKNKG